MSAYIVEDQTINQIVGYLSQLEGTSSKQWIIRPLTELGFPELRTNLDKQKELGEEMFKLNCESINQRYGENQAEQFRPLDYAFKPASIPMARQPLPSGGQNLAVIRRMPRFPSWVRTKNTSSSMPGKNWPGNLASPISFLVTATFLLILRSAPTAGSYAWATGSTTSPMPYTTAGRSF